MRYVFKSLILAFWIQLDGEIDRRVPLAYNVETTLQVLETTLPGDLAAAEEVKLRYNTRDVMCLEMLELESLDKSLHYDIIQVKITESF